MKCELERESARQRAEAEIHAARSAQAEARPRAAAGSKGSPCVSSELIIGDFSLEAEKARGLSHCYLHMSWAVLAQDHLGELLQFLLAVQALDVGDGQQHPHPGQQGGAGE